MLNGNESETTSTTKNGEAKSRVRSWFVSVLLHFLALLLMFQLSWFATARIREKETPMALVDLGEELKRSALTALDELTRTDLHERTRSTGIEPQVNQDFSHLTSGLDGLSTGQELDLKVLALGSPGASDADWGLAGAAGPEFFAAGGTRAKGASKVVYVVDRSGSMLESFDAVKLELVNSISRLRLSQKFHVVFFSSGPPLENPPRRLVNATQAQKEGLFKFLDEVAPEGSTNPIEAMRRAFMVEPDLIFFLTDGAFQDTLLSHLRTWNSDHRVRIFTIAYEDPEGANLLERIALEHGGEYRFVRRDYRAP